MNTPSHFLMTAALDEALPRMPIVRSAFLWGSVAPDIPLWLLSIGGTVYYHWILGWSLADTFRLMFDQLYFHHPFWIASHNLLHSPLILLVGMGLTYPLRRNINSSARWCFWFFMACFLHSIVDVFTHVDDGPLLLFPFDWQMRFRSPMSYWDNRYYGREFQQFEQVLNLIFILYLVSPRVYRWMRRMIRYNRN
jgi:hypothetical protein